jgi:hypothetical protein
MNSDAFRTIYEPAARGDSRQMANAHPLTGRGIIDELSRQMSNIRANLLLIP